MTNIAKCWVVGPIAWDWPYLVERLPASGGFAQGRRLSGRLGGTGANVARALASRWPSVGMVGYVGGDERGDRSKADLRRRAVDIEHVATIDRDTSEVLLLIEPLGERTIIGVVDDELEHVSIPKGAVARGDLVYFAAWRPAFAPIARMLAASGATVASVPFTPASAGLPVRYVIGSTAEVPRSAARDPYPAYRAWTAGEIEHVVITRGRHGARSFSPSGAAEHDAIAVEAVDATGAGDAFAAGVLASILERRSVGAGIADGLRWGALAAATYGSIPPPWQDVERAAGC